jgi:chromosome segregation ATPase
MKVKVNVKTSPKAQEKYYEQAIAEAYAEMETMFQENKDLRVSEGHLRDDLARAEALIAELNEQIAASEADVAYWKCKAQEAIAELAKFDVGYYQRAVDEWQTTADQLAEKCQKFQDERDKAWAALRGLQNVESELEYYRDIAAHRKERNDKLMKQVRELETELAELTEDYDALVQTKREYGEYIDTLRQENKRLRNQMPLPEFMRQFIEMTREAVQNEFPDSGNS